MNIKMIILYKALSLQENIAFEHRIEYSADAESPRVYVFMSI